MTLLDVMGGLVAAEAVLAGLLFRERTGRGCRADSSLLSGSTVLQYAALEAPSRGTSPVGCAGGRVEIGPVLRPPTDGWRSLRVANPSVVGCATHWASTAAPRIFRNWSTPSGPR